MLWPPAEKPSEESSDSDDGGSSLYGRCGPSFAKNMLSYDLVTRSNKPANRSRALPRALMKCGPHATSLKALFLHPPCWSIFAMSLGRLCAASRPRHDTAVIAAASSTVAARFLPPPLSPPLYRMATTGTTMALTLPALASAVSSQYPASPPSAGAAQPAHSPLLPRSSNRRRRTPARTRQEVRENVSFPVLKPMP